MKNELNAMKELTIYHKLRNMKNPFQREDSNTGLFAGLAIGAIFAGGIAYLYYKRKKEMAEIEAYKKEHAADYLEEKAPRPKRHKSDIDELHTIATQ
jgi:LPXTG-motif cell wall-anchored protein